MEHNINIKLFIYIFILQVYVNVAAAMAALGGILFGYDVGIISGALLQLRDEYHLDCFQKVCTDWKNILHVS